MVAGRGFVTKCVIDGAVKKRGGDTNVVVNPLFPFRSLLEPTDDCRSFLHA